MSQRKTERFIGYCSKLRKGQGWTVDIPVAVLENMGYVKVSEGDVVLSKDIFETISNGCKGCMQKNGIKIKGA